MNPYHSDENESPNKYLTSLIDEQQKETKLKDNLSDTSRFARKCKVLNM